MAKPKKTMMTAKPMKAIKAATKAAMISKASPNKKPKKLPKAMKAASMVVAKPMKAMMTAKPMKAIKAATKAAMISKASPKKKPKKLPKAMKAAMKVAMKAPTREVMTAEILWKTWPMKWTGGESSNELVGLWFDLRKGTANEQWLKIQKM